MGAKARFNPLDRVKFVQIKFFGGGSNDDIERFNPLDRVKFVQIINELARWAEEGICFNPLDRVKFVQILIAEKVVDSKFEFQSPRSGQICSNHSL